MQEAAQTLRTDKGPFLPPRKRARASFSAETVHFASSSAAPQQQWHPQPPCAFAHPDLPHAAHFEPHTPSLGTQQQQQQEAQQAAMQASMPANLAQQELSLPPSMADPAAFGEFAGRPMGMGMGMGAAGWNLQGMMGMMGRPAEQSGPQLHAEQYGQQGHAGAKRKLYEDTQLQKPAAKDGEHCASCCNSWAHVPVLMLPATVSCMLHVWQSRCLHSALHIPSGPFIDSYMHAGMSEVMRLRHNAALQATRRTG